MAMGEMMLRKVYVSAILLFVSCEALAIEPKDSYRPYPHPYPQIIQANDYATIEAIEALLRDLGREQRQEALSCAAVESVLSHQKYTDKKTVALFSTLKRLLSDLTKTHACAAANFAQYGTRTYNRISIVEFDFGATVLVLNSASNGSDNEERLYTLDTVERNESYFW